MYDVFFSYHWQDHAEVEPIAHALQERGLRVFLDRWYLTPGLSWVDRLATALNGCGAVAVLIGPHGLGRWQQRERDLALDRQAREPSFPVIPVLLPKAEPALDFLGLNTWIDLREGLADPARYEILSKAVRGEPPGPDIQESLQRTWSEICPYRGLRPFREEDARFFYGREAFIETITAATRRRNFIAVVGASGSGKSSVVRAGLVPHLRRRSEGGPVYEIVTMMPGDNALHQLAAALVPLLEPELSETDRLVESGKLAGEFRTGTVSLKHVLSRVLEKEPGSDRILLVVDQSEEIYTLCRDEAVQQHFVSELLSSTEGDHCSVVLTLRGDFYGRVLGNRALADRLQDSVVNLGPMERPELLRAIEQPAKEIGLKFEDGLVDRMLDDVGKEPGNLPLLEFVLEMLWQRRSRGEMHHQAYVEIGGVRGAIAKRANEVYETLSPAQQEAARRSLIQLVHPGEGTEDTRQRATLDDLDAVDAEARPVMDRLAAARLVVTGRDPTLGKDFVEVSHEALIQRWDLLKEWINADREFLRTRERIAAAANYWQENKRDRSLLLMSGLLAQGQDLLAKRRNDLGKLLIEFIETSQAAQKRRRWIIVRTVAGTVATIIVVLAGATVYSYLAYKSASISLTKAQINESRFQASLSEQQTENGNGTYGILLALAALPRSTAQPDRPYVVEAEAALFKAVQENREQHVLRGHTAPVNSVAFSPDGTRIVTASGDQTARVWDAASGQSLQVLHGHTAEVNSAAFSSDGTRIVTTSNDRTARVWDTASGQSLQVLQGHTAEVLSAAFSPDGTRIVTASGDQTARVWDTASGQSHVTGDGAGQTIRTYLSLIMQHLFHSHATTLGQSLQVLRGHTAQINSVAFSSDGSRIVTASNDRTARVWDAASGQSLLVLQGHTAKVRSAAFSRDGSRIVTASIDRTARVWDAARVLSLVMLRGHTAEVWSAAFSPDGTRIVTASWDRSARVWDAASGQSLLVLHGHTAEVRSVAISRDGSRIVTASWDRSARVWDTASGQSLLVLRGHTAKVLSAAFSPDGTRIVTASGDQTARVWDSASGQSLLVLHGHTAEVLSAAFNPDGTRIVTTSNDQTARVWDAASGQSLQVLQGHAAQVNSAAFSPNGARIVTASSDRTARVWDTASGKSLLVLQGHTAPVWSAAFSPDGTRIVTASNDRTACVWRTFPDTQTLINYARATVLRLRTPEEQNRFFRNPSAAY